jgi:hypothetical protein
MRLEWFVWVLAAATAVAACGKSASSGGGTGAGGATGSSTGSGSPTGSGGTGGAGGGATTGTGASGGSGTGGANAACMLPTVAGTCNTTPLPDGSYECTESTTDFSGPCQTTNMTWKAGATCPSHALYCCAQSNGIFINCFYGAWNDWGTEAGAMMGCSDTQGAWCPR